jgi:hypothetical protein
MEYTKNPYKLSRDYGRLIYLLDKGYEIVCWADYNWDKDDKTRTCRDICHARKIDNHYSVGVRGIEYCSYYIRTDPQNYSFATLLKMSNIEFIDI